LARGRVGSVASGIGYGVWYAALGGLTAARAAIVQLLVPVLAAAGAVALLGERLGAAWSAPDWRSSPASRSRS